MATLRASGPLAGSLSIVATAAAVERALSLVHFAAPRSSVRPM